MTIPNKHDKFLEEDYLEIENGLIDPFQKKIFEEVKDINVENHTISHINLDNYNYCKFLNTLSSDKFKKVIERIPLNLEETNLVYKDITNYKNKKKIKDKKNLIIANDNFKKMDEEILKIEDFCNKIINNIKIDIKEEIFKINFTNYLFYYMVLYLLTFSEKACKKHNKDRYSWKLNLPYILDIEIIKTLIELNSSISNQLLLCFDISNLENKILICYPDIIFNPLILNKIINKKNEINLRNEQKQWIIQIKDLINNYKNYIVNGDDMLKTYYFNTAGMGAGKTSICAIASSTFVNEANQEIYNHKVELTINENDLNLGKRIRHFNLGKRIIQLFIVPSKQVLISFGRNTANYVSTWFYNNDQINVMFKYTPQYRKGKNGKVYFQYTKEVNELDIPIVDKFINVVLWDKLHRKPLFNKRGDNLWIGGYDYFKPPSVIFCDPKGAEELINNKFDFEHKLGWYFLPVVDEWVATADCNIKNEDNHYLKSIKSIIYSNIKLQFLISASVNQNEILNNEYFNQYNLLFSPIVPTTNSLTEMYTYKNELVHPFSKVNFENINEAIDSWDFTVYRCITPKVLIEYCKIINYNIKYNDITNINNYINLVTQILNIIKNSDEEIKKQICNLKLVNNNIHNLEDSKTLYLTSSNISEEILRYIQPKLNKNTVLNKVEEYKNNIIQEINELKNEITYSKINKQKSNDGSVDEINQKIFDLEKLLESDDQSYFFSSSFGNTTVDKKWIDKWINILNDDQLTVVLSGYDLSFNDRTLDEAVKDVICEPKQIIDTISSMYGRNDPSVKNVVINDKKKILGFKTIMQAFARAGRSGKYDCVVTTRFNEFLLKKFNPTESSLNKVFNYEEWINSD
jgi:hypothetical protein